MNSKISAEEKKRVLVVLGTRPEVIKLAPVIREFAQLPQIDCRVCSTGQHREMIEPLFDLLAIRPDIDLQIMRRDQRLGALAAAALARMDELLLETQPDLVVVQGDTTTAFCAAFAAYMSKIAVAHVEAGLRTRNLRSPWPEEGNRQLLARLADLHLAPTATAKANLLAEGVREQQIAVTGNTVVDSLQWIVNKPDTAQCVIPGLPADWRVRWREQRLVLITGHRRENFGQGLDDICRALVTLSTRFRDVQFVFPVHLNPNVRRSVNSTLAPVAAVAGNIHLIEPLAYQAFVSLLIRAHLIISDSGGVQEEAPSLGKPVLVTRENTERPEATAAGVTRLVGTQTEAIVRETSRLLQDEDEYRNMAQTLNPFGDGRAAKRTVEACVRFMHSRYPLLDDCFQD